MTTNNNTESRVEVSKIEFKIGKDTIRLTPEEAKKLKEVLDTLFGKSEQHTHIHYDTDKWYYKPLTPYFDDKFEKYPYPVITWFDSSNKSIEKFGDEYQSTSADKAVTLGYTIS